MLHKILHKSPSNRSDRSKSRITRPLRNLESPHLPTSSTAIRDMTSPATSGRCLSNFEISGWKCRFRRLRVEFYWRGVCPAPPIGGLLVIMIICRYDMRANSGPWLGHRLPVPSRPPNRKTGKVPLSNFSQTSADTRKLVV